MTTTHFFLTDLYAIHKVIQNTQIVYAKELIVSTLRDYFSQDTRYHYVRDEWGNPKVGDMTNKSLTAGIFDHDTTRIWIGQENKQNPRFLPSVIVKHTGANYKPISFNQNKENLHYEKRLFQDGYGHLYNVSQPVYFAFAGAWDTNFDMEIETDSPVDRSIIAECISLLFQNIKNDDLHFNGLFVKNTRVSGENSEDFQNGKIFKQTVSIECRGEYRRIVPVANTIDIINLCIDFGSFIPPSNSTFDENLRINAQVSLLDIAYNKPI